MSIFSPSIYSTFLNSKIGNGVIFNGDCREVMKFFNEDSVDLIVTSPPYNVDMNYVGYDDNLNYEEYLNFLFNVWKECYRVLKWNGRICVNIGNASGGVRNFTVGEIAGQLKKIGYEYRDNIVWYKQNISKRTAWGSWLSPSSPYLIAPYEFILVYDKGVHRKRGFKSDLVREEFIEWTNSLWNFNGESRDVGHPAPFPEELPYRLIKLYSYIGDVVLDPFFGSGTTGVVAEKLRRRWVGIELSREYYDVSIKRMSLAV